MRVRLQNIGGLDDLLVFFYVLALIRQLMWPISSNTLAWLLTISVSALVWYLHFLKKPRVEQHEEKSLLFWIVIALPLFGFYVIRVSFPDTSYDLLNYRLVASEGALRGLPSFIGNFLRNPMPDMITGIWRHLFGYRIGTIVNYLTSLWIATILNRLLRDYIESKWQRCLAVLLIVLTENVLFEINNYMVDLLALPLLLEATYLVLHVDQGKKESSIFVYSSILMGMSVALKLSNLAFVLPIMSLGVYALITGRYKLNLKSSFACVAGFIAPLLPFSVYMSWATGNPVYPFLNKSFQSPYIPPHNTSDPRWGPAGVWKIVLWPVLVLFEPERASELPGHTGRIALGFVIACLGVLLFRLVDKSVRDLSVIVLVGSILWSCSAGYFRYGIFLELIAGVMIFSFCSWLSREQLRLPRTMKPILLLLPWCVLGAQSLVACSYGYKHEWSERPTVFSHFEAYVRDSHNLFSDYSLSSFLSPATRELVGGVELWLESSPQTSGIETMLNRSIPVIYLRGYYEADEPRAKFAKSIDEVRSKKAASLCFAEDFKTSGEVISSRGLAMGRITPIEIPYYSYNAVFRMVLIEVLPAGSQVIGARVSSTNRPLPEQADTAPITAPGAVNHKGSDTLRLNVKVE